MIYSLEGTVTRVEDGWIVLETTGIGFRVRALDSFLTSVSLGKIARVVCFLQQEPLTVYGFGTEEELSLFELLNTVSGIGPKIAIKIMNAVPAKRLISLILLDQKEQFSSQAGIGIKVASKIILDLKEKLNKGIGKDVRVEAGMVELESILSELGYKQKDVESIISQIPTDVPIEQKVKMALKLLSPKRQ
jgi:Holliday junction DNA helicase RuvA